MDHPIALAEQLTPHLRALRQARGLSQAQLGKLLGLSQARIADIEKNPGVVGLEQILKVLNALGARLVIRTEAETEAPGEKTVVSPKGSW